MYANTTISQGKSIFLEQRLRGGHSRHSGKFSRCSTFLPLIENDVFVPHLSKPSVDVAHGLILVSGSAVGKDRGLPELSPNEVATALIHGAQGGCAWALRELLVRLKYFHVEGVMQAAVGRGKLRVWV